MHPHIELWQLRYFVAVAEELSFRKAAERLSITQPPLTRQIRALEEALGGRLFVRLSSGVELTSAGDQLLVESRTLLAAANELIVRMRRHRDRQDSLRLGITTVVDASLFTWVHPAVSDGLQGVRLIQTRQHSRRSIADLRRGALDLAIIGLPSATLDLTVETLIVDPLVAALPEDHRLARRRSVWLTELQSDPMFWFPRTLNPAYFDHFESIFRDMHFAPPRLPEPADHHVLLGLIADRQGFALVPRSLTSIRRSGVVYKILRDSEPLAVLVAIAYRADRLTSSAGWLLALLKQHFRVPRGSQGNAD